MGRNTKGQRYQFQEGGGLCDRYGIVESDQQRLLTLSEFGYGKMSLLEEYSTQKRAELGYLPSE